MRKEIFMLVAMFLLTCGNQKKAVTTPMLETVINMNKTVPDDEDDTIMLIGLANEDRLKKEPFNIWYNKNYDEYTVDNSAILSLKNLLSDVKIKVFMGTWCSDSQREAPRFFKIMESAGFDKKNIELISMLREKDTPEGHEVGFNITYVPTFIIYKNEIEINRIVESSVISLEKDLISILTGQGYKHTYAN